MRIGRIECSRLGNLLWDQRVIFEAHATNILDVAIKSVDHGAVLAYADAGDATRGNCGRRDRTTLLDLGDCIADVLFTHRG